MPEAGNTPEIFRFGPFELSVETGELRKNGVRVPLAGQPIQVLTLLVRSPGRLVTRDDLKRLLWPGSDFGDFETGLNAAVNRLRDRLGDSATEPKYIETVPGRGYRFIGEIEPEKRHPSPLQADPVTHWKGEHQPYILVAFIPLESAVERAVEVVVWVRQGMPGRRFFLRQEIEGPAPLGGTFYEREFPLEVQSDDCGNHQWTNIVLRLDSPNFEPCTQVKKLSVPPSGDSTPCTFLVKPCMPGELLANLELLGAGEKVLASRSIRTKALHLPDDDFHSPPSMSFGILKRIYEDLRQSAESSRDNGATTLEHPSRAIEPSPVGTGDAPIAILEAETGGFRGQSFTLTEGMTGVSIGRSKECEVCLEHPYVSRVHCRLWIEPAYHETEDPARYTFTLIDCGSRAGTQLNGEPVTRANLRDGDRFQIGTIRLRLVVLSRESVATPNAVTSHNLETDSPACAEQQTRVLEAAAPKEATVGCSIEVVAMVREGDSEGGLGALLLKEKVPYFDEDDVRERPFEVEFPLDADGKPQPLSISLRLESPGFEPPSQIKKLRVPPSGNSPTCTFLVSPRLVGEHVMNLELLDPHEQILVSRSIRTRALPSGVESGSAKILITIPLLVVIRGTVTRDGASGSEHNETRLFGQDFANFDFYDPGNASEQVQSVTEEPKPTKDIHPIDFTRTFQAPIGEPGPDQSASQRLTGLPKEGMVISHYRLIEVVGQSGTMVVCKAEDLKTGRLVAVKLRPTKLVLGARSAPNGECFLDDVEELPPSERIERDRTKAAGGVEHAYHVERHSPRRPRWWLIASGGLVLGFLVVIFGLQFLNGPKRKMIPTAVTPGAGSIVLADFTNSTGDPAFDGLDPLGHHADYDSRAVLSSPVEILSPDQVRQILTQMNRNPDEQLTPALAREVCLRANAYAVATGSISANGPGYKIIATAINCHTGQTLGTAEGDVGKISAASTDVKRAYVSMASRDVVEQLFRNLRKQQQ